MESVMDLLFRIDSRYTSPFNWEVEMGLQRAGKKIGEVLPK